MGHQAKDSKFCEHGLSIPESVLADRDRLLLPPPTVKIVSQDPNNVDITLVSKSGQQSRNETGSAGCSAKLSGVEITNDIVSTVSQDQSPVSETSKELLVYRRRKTKSLSAKSNISNNQFDFINSSQSRNNVTHLDESASEKTLSDQPGICTVEAPRISHASSVCLSSDGTSFSQCHEKSNNLLSPSSLNKPQLSPVRCSGKHGRQWQERYIELQTMLRMLDHSDQQDYKQMLMKFSWRNSADSLLNWKRGPLSFHWKKQKS